MLVLVTGGARSGKSGFAERYAACLGNRGIYVATSRIWDAEMRDRVDLHRSAREESDFPWMTVEEPLQLAECLDRLGGGGTGPGSVGPGGAGAGENAARPEELSLREERTQPVILVDCLTLWLTNVLLDTGEEEWSREAMNRAAARAESEVDRLAGVLRKLRTPVLLVTNEVGDGVVPEYPLGRLFRDTAGRMNQRLAALCDEVFLVTAGIPVELKRLAFRLPPVWAAAEEI